MIESHLSFRSDRFRISTIVLLEIANIIAHFRSLVAKVMLTDGQHSQKELCESYVTLVLKSRLIMFSFFDSNLISKSRTRSQSDGKIR